LIDQGRLSSAEQDYLDLLGTLIWEYEARNEDKTAYVLRSVELVKGLVESHGLKLNNLTPIFKTKSIASAVLNGKRRLTVEHINRLAGFFRLSHSLFFEPVDHVML
jgi:HTH-type transcriptional regulator/antitoxin HigA